MVSIHDSQNVSLYLSGLKPLRRLKTDHHQVTFYQHLQLGHVLVMDKEIQHVEAWAPLYHEPLIHLPASFIPEVRSALVLGGGSLYAARELLKYRSIERVVLVDHDSELLDVMTDTYDHAAQVRRDPRLEIHTTDAFRSITTMSEHFDLVANDSVDLLSINASNVFQSLLDLLNPEGVCSDVIYRHIFEARGLGCTLRTFRSVRRTAVSLIFVPEYPGVLHLLTMWGKTSFLKQNAKQVVNREQQRWALNPRKNPCLYYDPRYLPYYMHLPRYVREQIRQSKAHMNARLKLSSRSGQSTSSK